MCVHLGLLLGFGVHMQERGSLTGSLGPWHFSGVGADCRCSPRSCVHHGACSCCSTCWGRMGFPHCILATEPTLRAKEEQGALRVSKQRAGPALQHQAPAELQYMGRGSTDSKYGLLDKQEKLALDNARKPVQQALTAEKNSCSNAWTRTARKTMTEDDMRKLQLEPLLAHAQQEQQQVAAAGAVPQQLDCRYLSWSQGTTHQRYITLDGAQVLSQHCSWLLMCVPVLALTAPRCACACR